MTVRAVVMLLVVLGIAPAAYAQSGPSFDCRKAVTAGERAICASAPLQKLDREVATAYSDARAGLGKDIAGREGLRQLQRRFNDTRDYLADGGPPFALSLVEFLTGQRDKLNTIASARSGFAGVWVSATAVTEIRPLRSGGFSISISGAEPTAGRWLCDVQGEANLASGRLSLGGPNLEGWRIGLRRVGATLVVEETAPANQANATRPYCGMNGGVADTFLPAR